MAVSLDSGFLSSVLPNENPKVGLVSPNVLVAVDDEVLKLNAGVGVDSVFCSEFEGVQK